MSEQDQPDLTAWIAAADIAEGTVLAGRVGDADVMLARVSGAGAGDAAVLAWDAGCTHAGASLPKGLRRGDTVHCPFHHACFSLRTGEALLAPAFAPLGSWSVEVSGDRVRVLDRSPEPAPPARVENTRGVRGVVVIGGGAAGYATVERLRRVGYDASLTLLSVEPTLPVDRTKLSKGYLGGQAGADALPLAPADWYRDQNVDVRLGTTVRAVDVGGRTVSLADGTELAFDAAVLATGAEPVRLELPGFDRADVHLLRTPADADAIIAAADRGGPVVVLGGGFIGLETAAAMRDRGVEVTVVLQSEIPLAAVLGAELGRLVRSVHESHGVRFAVGDAVGWDGSTLLLADGSRVHGTALVVGAGVRPRTELAGAAGLRVDGGIVVDALGETSAPGVFAAGDCARFPDPATGKLIRVEHWAVAGRAGGVAALNLLGADRPLVEPPYFWSKNFDLNIRFAGYAGTVGPDGASASVEGSLADRDAVVRYTLAGRLAAVATVGRDHECLEIEDAQLRPSPA